MVAVQVAVLRVEFPLGCGLTVYDVERALKKADLVVKIESCEVVDEDGKVLL